MIRYLNESDFNTSGYYLPAIHGEGEVNPHYLMTKSCINNLVFLTPAPLCYIFDMEQNPMVTGVGLLTEKGKYNFDYFNYEYKDNRCSFVTDFYEYTQVCGECKLPSIIVNIGKNEEDILRKYSDYHYKQGYCNKDEKNRLNGGMVRCFADGVTSGYACQKRRIKTLTGQNRLRVNRWKK